MKAKTSKDAYRQLTELINNSLQTQEPDEVEIQEAPKLKIAPQTMKKFESLMLLEKITPEDLKVLSMEEKQIFSQFLTQTMSEKKEYQLDTFIKKTDGIISPDTRESIREGNHNKISAAILSLVRKNGQMPGKMDIVRETGLSRGTVQKHLTEYSGSEDFKARIKEYQFMKTGVMDRIMKAAANGDMRAAKLYMDTVDKMAGLETKTTVINQQNNFIQINGVVKNLQDLPVETLKQIEEIIKLPLAVINE